MTRKITLFRTDQGWMAQDDDPEVRRLFGTDTIPTAFTATAEPEFVAREIARLNPDAEVTYFSSP